MEKDFTKSVMNILGREFTFNGHMFRVVMIKHLSCYGNNFSIRFVDAPIVVSGNHPYGNNNFLKEFSKILPTGLKAVWSESGMQTDDTINVDIVKTSSKK